MSTVMQELRRCIPEIDASAEFKLLYSRYLADGESFDIDSALHFAVDGIYADPLDSALKHGCSVEEFLGSPVVVKLDLESRCSRYDGPGKSYMTTYRNIIPWSRPNNMRFFNPLELIPY